MQVRRQAVATNPPTQFPLSGVNSSSICQTTSISRKSAFVFLRLPFSKLSTSAGSSNLNSATGGVGEQVAEPSSERTTPTSHSSSYFSSSNPLKAFSHRRFSALSASNSCLSDSTSSFNLMSLRTAWRLFFRWPIF